MSIQFKFRTDFEDLISDFDKQSDKIWQAAFRPGASAGPKLLLNDNKYKYTAVCNSLKKLEESGRAFDRELLEQKKSKTVSEDFDKRYLKPLQDAFKEIRPLLTKFRSTAQADAADKTLNPDIASAFSSFLRGFYRWEKELIKIFKELLKEAPDEEPEMKLAPTSFAAQYKKETGKQESKEVLAILKDTYDALKKLDTNKDFHKLSGLVEDARRDIQKAIKELSSLKDEDKKEIKKIVDTLKDFDKKLDDYDNRMFLLSKYF